MQDLSSYYDLIASITKNNQVIDQELELIKKHIEIGSSILDIGCGTGRHLVPLVKIGYKVHGLDSNDLHLKSLLKKIDHPIKLYNSPFDKAVIKDRYDALILFWNSINEICLDHEQLRNFFIKAQSILKDRGKMIINIDDISNLDLSHLHFEFQGVENGENFQYNFHVMDYDPQKNITRSIETLYIKKESTQAELLQKWWSSDELKTMANEYGFNSITEHITCNDELYLIFTRS